MYNVMIVDDELWFRSYLKELIDQSGSEFLVCAQAANGAEALKILAAQPVDVVIADVLMPVMDGVELMQHLSDLPHRLPVCFLCRQPTGWEPSLPSALAAKCVMFLLRVCCLH